MKMLVIFLMMTFSLGVLAQSTTSVSGCKVKTELTNADGSKTEIGEADVCEFDVGDDKESDIGKAFNNPTCDCKNKIVDAPVDPDKSESQCNDEKVAGKVIQKYKYDAETGTTTVIGQ